MYKIFLHISSITILEICFFFYYIGPLETNVFLNYVKKIIHEPISNLDDTLSKLHLSRDDFLNILFKNEDEEKIKENLYVDSINGKNERMDDNDVLFNETLEHWSFILIIALLLFTFERVYIYFQNRKGSYRKSSIDDQDEDSSNDITLIDSEKKDTYKLMKSCLKVTGHYIVFGGGILTFQYLFFQYVVFEYKPLSVEEIKYYVYCYLIKE